MTGFFRALRSPLGLWLAVYCACTAYAADTAVRTGWGAVTVITTLIISSATVRTLVSGVLWYRSGDYHERLLLKTLAEIKLTAAEGTRGVWLNRDEHLVYCVLRTGPAWRSLLYVAECDEDQMLTVMSDSIPATAVVTGISPLHCEVSQQVTAAQKNNMTAGDAPVFTVDRTPSDFSGGLRAIVTRSRAKHSARRAGLLSACAPDMRELRRLLGNTEFMRAE